MDGVCAAVERDAVVVERHPQLARVGDLVRVRGRGRGRGRGRVRVRARVRVRVRVRARARASIRVRNPCRRPWSRARRTWCRGRGQGRK